MKKAFLCAAIFLTVFAFAACSDAVTDPAALGRIAAEIEKEPHKMDEILSRHQHTRESFEAVVRKLAEDPKKAEAYTKSYEQHR